MTQQIINVGANANDGTGEPLREAFTAVNDNFTQIWTAGPVGSQVKISGNIVTTTVTNLGLTLAGNGIGNIQANSTIVPGTSGVYDLGAPTNTFQYIYGDYLVGNGALITGINVSTTYNNSNVAAFLPTYTGNLVSLTGPIRTTANVIAGNLITTGFLGVTGAITGGNITGNNLLSSGYVSAVGNITTVGNIAGNYFTGNGALLTGIAASNVIANALVGNTLSSNVLYSSLKVVDDLLYLDVIGNVTTSGRFIGSGTGLTNIPAANISGQVANALVASTVYTNAQPNITSVGTLTSLSSTGNVTANYFVGNGSQLTGIVASNVAASLLIGNTLSSNILYSSLKVVDDLEYLDVIGNITTQGRFIGSGTGLSNIPGANVTGTVATATTATTAGTVTTNAQPNITSVGTLTSLSSTGNISGNYFIGNGSQLTGITASSVSANALTGATLSANVLNSTLVSVGNLNSLSVIGNTISGNLATAGVISATGNITTANYFIGNGRQLTGIRASDVGVLANLSVTGNTQTGNLLTGGIVSAVGNIKTLGNVSGNYFIGNGSQLTGIIVSAGAAITNGNSNVTVNANGNVTVGVAGYSNVAVFANTGVYVAGVVSATGNVTGNYLLGNGALITGLPAGYSNADVANYLPTYTGNLVSLTGPVTTTSNVTGGNVLTAGVISATGTITSAANIVGGNVTTAGQVTATGNITGGNVVTDGLISATGNIQGNVFVGNGAGLTSLVGANVTGIVANATSAVTAGTVTSNAQANITSVGILTSVSVSGNTTTGNLLTGGLISATSTITSAANISGGNILTGGLISATGNVTAGNFITTGPSGNISGANVISASTFSATANITGGNILTVGLVSATGNVYGNAILSNNYYYANGTPVPPGIIYTAATSPPGTPKVTDQWYNTASDVLYEYLNDGTSEYWVDTTSPAFAGGVVANVAISGTLLPVANVTYDIGTSTAYFRNTYTQNLYTNNRLPIHNMPLGAVVQTVMSNSLGGSTTNSTSYVDVTYATVTITPSSATSKVLILATGTSEFSAVVGYGITADTQLIRSPSTSLQAQTIGVSGAGGGATGAVAYSYMDAPATTSAVTYKLQQKVSSASSTLSSTNIWLIAQEIAAS